jgi:hypothetical protein
MTKNNKIRFTKDTGNRDPHYYLPAIMLYFYNNGVISFDELKYYLSNEIPHSFLFNPKKEGIMGAGDFIVNEDGYVVKVTGYSGHTKPRTSNIFKAVSMFNEMGYNLQMEPIEEIVLQTDNTERHDMTERLIGNYLKLTFIRP